MIDPKQLRDAKLMSEAEYFLKYQEHPSIVVRQDEEDGSECRGCQ